MPPKRINSSSDKTLLARPSSSHYASPKTRRITQRRHSPPSSGSRRRITRHSDRRDSISSSDEEDDDASSDEYKDSSSMQSSSGDSSGSMPATPTTPNGGAAAATTHHTPSSPPQHALNSPFRQMKLGSQSMVVTPTTPPVTPNTPAGTAGTLDHLMYAAGLLPSLNGDNNARLSSSHARGSLYEGLGSGSGGGLAFAAYPDLTPSADNTTGHHSTYTLNPDEWGDAETGYDAATANYATTATKRKSPRHAFFVLVLGWRPTSVDMWMSFKQMPLIDTSINTYQITHHQANSAARDVLSQLFGNRLIDPVTQQPVPPYAIPDYWSKFVNRTVYVAVYDSAKHKVSVFTSTAEWITPSERMPFERTRLAPLRELMTFHEVADVKNMRSILYIREILDVSKQIVAARQRQQQQSLQGAA